MARYLGPLRKKLRAREEKKTTASGIHKGKRKRVSIFGLQLQGKQIIKDNY